MGDAAGNDRRRADHDHTFNLGVNHSFSERYKVALTDAFVIGQEPDALRVGSIASVQRVAGNNIRNYGTIEFNGQLTPVFGIAVGYANQLFNYDRPEFSAALDRIEHRAHVDGEWLIQPETKGILGYAYGQTVYTGDAPIGFGFMSKDRDNRSHTGYVGVDHSFRPDLSVSLRGGAQFIDFYNDSAFSSEVSPYVQASLKYTYMEESYIQVGLTQSRSATDQTGVSGSDFVHDSDNTVVYGTIFHRIVPNLFGSLTGTFQNAVLNGGDTLNGKSEQFLQLGAGLQYRFNPNFSSEVGYNYDKLDGNTGREYSRNRVYIGLTASY